MQAVLCSAQSSASVSTSFFAATSPAVFSSGLATISVGASLSAVGALLQALPSGIRLVTFSGSTPERQSVWGTLPNGVGFAALGTPFFDSTLGAQLFADGVTGTGWSSRTAAGI
jgi:hypothetical protein